MDFPTMTEVISRHLGTVLRAIEFDIVPDDDGGIDVTTDTWTIHFGEKNGFIAVDSEPDDTAAFEVARREIMNESVERAIAAADGELNGQISSALAASCDPFSVDFANVLLNL